jgi:hypothetical protein
MRAQKDLAAEILRVKIQQKEHCPVYMLHPTPLGGPDP